LQPRLIVVVRDVDHQRVSLPMAARIAHPQLDVLANVRAAIERDHTVAVVIVEGDQHHAGKLLNLHRALIIDSRYAFLEAAADGIEILELRWFDVLRVQKLRELRRPGLIGDLAVNRIDDWAADHWPLTADGGVPGTLGLRVFDAVGDDVARLPPLAF